MNGNIDIFFPQSFFSAFKFKQFHSELSRAWHVTCHNIFHQISLPLHYNDVIMGSMASQITSLAIVYTAVYLGAYQRTYQSSASLAFVGGIHREPVNSLHKWPVKLKTFPFDDVIMEVPVPYVYGTRMWAVLIAMSILQAVSSQSI